MPYIKQEDRRIYQAHLEVIPKIETPGELNYVLTKLVHKYLGDTPNYQAYNDVIGALEGCKLELYREHTAKYEDLKKNENGPT